MNGILIMRLLLEGLIVHIVKPTNLALIEKTRIFSNFLNLDPLTQFLAFL